MDTFRYSEHPQSLALQPKWPALVIQELNTQKQPSFVYDQSQEVGPVHVEDWIQLYIGGVLTPSLKSQPVPEVQNDNVYTLVSKEFDAVVFDDSEGYVYEFLRFLCGQCKRLAPTWEFLASHYAPLKKNLVIAKMEAIENELPASVPFTISGFPTLKFKPAGTREFVDYKGNRSYDSQAP